MIEISNILGVIIYDLYSNFFSSHKYQISLKILNGPVTNKETKIDKIIQPISTESKVIKLKFKPRYFHFSVVPLTLSSLVLITNIPEREFKNCKTISQSWCLCYRKLLQSIRKLIQSIHLPVFETLWRNTTPEFSQTQLIYNKYLLNERYWSSQEDELFAYRRPQL